jgi:penicillin amidase
MRRLARVVVGAASLLGLTGAGGAWFLGRSLPDYSGEQRVAGISAPVDIVRDESAVPHIYAASEADAYFGLGYVHAQDRLWQLELNRRLGSGTLAEVLGEDALEQDRLFRTLGLRRLAEQNLVGLDPRTRDALAAYARGVNAFLAGDPALPPEFGVLGVSMRPWSEVDSLVFLEVMGYWMSETVGRELLRMRLSARLTPEQLSAFVAPYPGDPPVVLGDLKELYGSLERPARVLGAVLPGIERSKGSNNWAVSGTRSASGKPLLANDPHLEFSAPSIWYLAHLAAPGLNVIGASLPSLPGIILGRNDHLAWAFTNTESDTQDLFIERLASADGATYDTPNGPRPFDVRREVIHVRGAPDELLDVRASRHGPILSDVEPEARALLPRGYVLAFNWVGFGPGDTTLEFPVHAARSHDAGEFLGAARRFLTPQQNIVYADDQGNIGFIAAGRVPVRRPDNDLRGLAPAPGWDARYDWQGYVPFEELPRESNPASSRIVTANQRITPPGYRHWLGSEWQPPYRAERIQSLIDARERHTLGSFAAIQTDARSNSAALLLPRLLRFVRSDGAGGAVDQAASSPAEPLAGHFLDRLTRWDGAMSVDAAEPLVFAAWVRELTRLVYADELGDAFEDTWSERTTFLDNVLADRDGQARWCDDVGTPSAESCARLCTRALDRAIADLRARYGEDPQRWSWGGAHPAVSAHVPFSSLPLLQGHFGISVPTPGDNQSVNVGGYDLSDEEQPFASSIGPTYRALYDLGDPESSLFIASAGQSGHFLSQHYADFSQRWARGEYAPMQTKRSDVEANAIGVLKLNPN